MLRSTRVTFAALLSRVHCATPAQPRGDSRMAARQALAVLSGAAPPLLPVTTLRPAAPHARAQRALPRIVACCACVAAPPHALLHMRRQAATAGLRVPRRTRRGPPAVLASREPDGVPEKEVRSRGCPALPTGAAPPSLAQPWRWHCVLSATRSLATLARSAAAGQLPDRGADGGRRGGVRRGRVRAEGRRRGATLRAPPFAPLCAAEQPRATRRPAGNVGCRRRAGC